MLEFNTIKLFGLLVLINLFSFGEGHGRLVKPPSRSSIWRFPEYSDQNPPINYNDNELFCGSIHQVDDPGTNCGVCGDSFSQPTPRDNEFGGKFYRGIITGHYSVGEVINVEVDITAQHLGYMEWRLCPNGESQNCFDQNLLQREDDQGSKVNVSNTGLYRTRLRLPFGLQCDHCVIQWNYRAGNNWGQCQDGTGRLGCGPQETFRGCADISIVS